MYSVKEKEILMIKMNNDESRGEKRESSRNKYLRPNHR